VVGQLELPVPHLERVYDQKNHVGFLYRFKAPPDGQLLHQAFRALADAGGVHQDEGLAAEGEVHVDGVPGGAGLLRHDDPFLPQDGVQEAALSGIGSAHDGELDARHFRLRLDVPNRKLFPDGFQEFLEAPCMLAGGGDGIAETQGVEGAQVVLVLGVVHLGGHQDHGLALLPQVLRHLIVRLGEL
jgi:hypothetical protein